MCGRSHGLTARAPADERDSRLDASDDERSIEPEHAIARANQHRITLRVRSSLLGVTPTIDLDHEPLSGRQEVSAKPPKQRHLTAKHHAEPTPANAGPEQRLGRSERRAHAASALVQERRPRCISIAKQGLLWVRVMPTHGAGAVTAPRLVAHPATGWARGVASPRGCAATQTPGRVPGCARGPGNGGEESA